MRTTIVRNNFDNFLGATGTIRESWYGKGGDDTFSIYHYNSEIDFPSLPDLSDRFFGGSGDDLIETLYFDLNVGSGLSKYSQLSFDGGKGYDTVSSHAAVEMVAGFKLELDKIETNVISVEHWKYDIELFGGTEGGRFTLIAGAQDDTLNISQMEQVVADGVRVKTQGGNDNVTYHAGEDLSNLEVNTGKGNDYFEFTSARDVTANLSIVTGKGKDTVVINGSSNSSPDGLTADIRTGSGGDKIVLEGMHAERLRAGTGSDDIYILTGSFSNAADTVSTGGGRDRLFIELDDYSTVAIVDDFSASKDIFVFDAAEAVSAVPRDTEVTFDQAEWRASDESLLFMSNEENRLYFGDNVLVEFSTDVELSSANFTTDTWGL